MIRIVRSRYLKDLQQTLVEFQHLLLKRDDDQQAAISMFRREKEKLEAQVVALERMNSRLQSDLDWAKLRLNAVEKERAQLIAAAIGVKISIPEFVPKTDNPEEALNQLPDLSTVGNDAKEDNTQDWTKSLGQELAVDYSLMPGYRGE